MLWFKNDKGALKYKKKCYLKIDKIVFFIYLIKNFNETMSKIV